MDHLILFGGGCLNYQSNFYGLRYLHDFLKSKSCVGSGLYGFIYKGLKTRLDQCRARVSGLKWGLTRVGLGLRESRGNIIS